MTIYTEEKENVHFQIFVYQARDADSGENSQLVYSLEQADRFSVDPLSGQVSSTASFLGQAGTIFTLTAVARDLGGGEGGLAATCKLTVSTYVYISVVSIRYFLLPILRKCNVYV
jgi:hypothetical protein